MFSTFQTTTPIPKSNDYTKILSSEPISRKKTLPSKNENLFFTDNVLDVSLLQESSPFPNREQEMKMTTFVTEEETVSVQITPDKTKNQYMVLLGSPDDSDSDEDEDIQRERIIKPFEIGNNDDDDDKPKMNLWAQFYLGSLSVVGLYILYRMIHKTK
jgi:hypothetical protein